MKIWITASAWTNDVEIHPTKPHLAKEDGTEFWTSGGGMIACREHVEKLLIGSERRLPRHNSKGIIEGELTFKPKENRRGKKSK